MSAEWRPVLIEHQPPTIHIRGGEPDGVIRADVRNDGRGRAINCWITIEYRTSKDRTISRFRHGIIPTTVNAGWDARILYPDPDPEPFVRYTVTA